MPLMAPAGDRIQRRTSTVLAGNDLWKVAECASMRRLAVRSSGNSRSLETEVAFQPRGTSAVSGKSALAVDPREHRLDLRDRGLDLDHEERTGRAVERQDVDRSALVAHLEGHLGSHFLCARIEDGDGSIHQARVARIEQPVETLAVPQQPDVDAGIEPGRDQHEGVDGHTVGAAAFDPTDDRRRDASQGRQMGLRPAPAHAQRAHPETESDDIHRDSIGGSPSLGRISGCIAAAKPADVPQATIGQPGVRQMNAKGRIVRNDAGRLAHARSTVDYDRSRELDVMD